MLPPMNYIRSISVIVISLLFTLDHVTDLGLVLVGIWIFGFPLLIPMGIITLFSIPCSILKFFLKKQEHKSIRIANYFLLGCLLICGTYSGGMYLYVKSHYDLVAYYFERDGIFSGYRYVLFSKEGEMLSCSSVTRKITFPLTKKGSYLRKGDSILCEKDTFVIESNGKKIKNIVDNLHYEIDY